MQRLDHRIPVTNRQMISMTEDQKEHLLFLARERGCNVSEVVRNLIDESLAEDEETLKILKELAVGN